MSRQTSEFRVSAAVPADVPQILELIRSLAEYERLSHLCVATDADIHAALFGATPRAEVVIAWSGVAVAGFALFFHNFSTFLGRPGLWLEDLFVRPPHRGQGCGRQLLTALAAIARERRCGRFEWAVLDWNERAIDFYRSLGAMVLPDWRIVRVVGSSLD